MFLSHIKVKGNDYFIICHYLLQKLQGQKFLEISPDFTSSTSSPPPENERVSLSCSSSAPEYPAAATTLPQFGSFPKIADLTRGERTIAFAASLASLYVFAPTTLASISFVAPSPSLGHFFCKLREYVN